MSRNLPLGVQSQVDFTVTPINASGAPVDPGTVTATLYADVSVASLSAGQAAGTSTVIAANSARKALMINPPADCILTITNGATKGWPLFANVPNTITGQECPANALYVYGLAAAATLTMWEG